MEMEPSTNTPQHLSPSRSRSSWCHLNHFPQERRHLQRIYRRVWKAGWDVPGLLRAQEAFQPICCSRSFQEISASPRASREEQGSLEEMGTGPFPLHLCSAWRSPVLHIPQLCWWQGYGELRNKASSEHSTGRQVCPVPLPQPFPSGSAG